MARIGDSRPAEGAAKASWDLTKYGNGRTVPIRHYYQHALYRALLAHFPPHSILEFYATCPLRQADGSETRGPALFRLLWDEQSTIPLYWDYAVDNVLEEFVVRAGRDFPAFYRSVLWRNNRSTYIPGKILLGWLFPQLQSFLDRERMDANDLIYLLLTTFVDKFLAGTIYRRISHQDMGGLVRSTLIYINEPEFREYLQWDFEHVAGPQTLIAPAMLGLPELERLGMLADSRHPASILWPENGQGVLRPDGFYLDGRRIGHTERFSPFCRSLGLDLSKYQVPDEKVVVMDEDVICPLRRRTVLHRGCAYLAPVFLSWVEHRPIVGAPASILAPFIQDASEEVVPRDGELELEERHRKVLALCEGRLRFTYHAGDESVTLNGRHLVRGIPAKILREILRAHVGEGRTEFEHREFKRNFEISLGQKRSNFEVRFYRLADKLRQECPGLRVEMRGRGRFDLVAETRVEFEEA